MKIIKDLIKIPNLSIASGFFDGVHLAHQKVIKSAVNFARQNNTQSVVITFARQPLCYIKNICPSYISTRAQSYEIIEKLGADYLIELDFEKVSNLSPLEYLELIVKNLSPCGIFTGFNHHFGCNRAGNPEFLKKYQNEFNYKYFDLPAQKLNDDIISSTNIRNFIKNGEIENANLMLGRDFFIQGEVVEGNKIGRTIDFPTANLNYPSEIVEPPKGAYSVKVKLSDGKIYNGIANFGTKPTVSNTGIKLLETHILDEFNQDIYGHEIKVEFLKFLRPEQKFNNIEDLKAQIQKDIESIRI